MSKSGKLVLDIVVGAVIPIFILDRMSGTLGSVPAYLLAALIPVAYVLADTLLITRRFNFITSFTALAALVRGALAFWFVDGALFALKDTAGQVVNAAVFGGSLAIARPLFGFFFTQALNPPTLENRRALTNLMRSGRVAAAIRSATLLVCAEAVLTGAANFALNVNIVTAPFGTELFNSQVAQVNAITRIAFVLTSFAAFGGAFYLAFRAVTEAVGAKDGEELFTDAFWQKLNAPS